MIKFEYIPWTAERTWGYAEDVPPVESVTMTLGGDVSWEEAVCEFHNFLRASGYVIPYDFEDDYVDCSDPPDMDKSGSLGDRQPEWANRMHGPDKWWHQSNTEEVEAKRTREQMLMDIREWARDDSNTGVASEDESNTDVASEDESNTDVAEKPAWIPLKITERNRIIDEWNSLVECTVRATKEGRITMLCKMIEAKLKELNT